MTEKIEGNAHIPADMRGDREPPTAVNDAPEWQLWRWIARALGQLLACLAHGRAGPVGGGADMGDRCEQGVLPEVVGLPRGDLVEQVRLGAAAPRGRCRDGELELVVLPSAECALGQEPLADPLQGQRLFRAGPAPVQRVGGQAEEDLAREGVVAGCKGASSLTSSKMSASRTSPSSRIRRAVAASWGVGSFLAGIP